MKTAIKNVLGIWIDLEWKVKYSTILVFKAIFIHPNSVESFYKTISLKNMKIGEQLLLLTYFDNCDS